MRFRQARAPRDRDGAVRFIENPASVTVWLMVGLALCLLFFRSFPGVDTGVTALFFDGGSGLFSAAEGARYQTLRWAGLHLPRLIALGCALWLLWVLFAMPRKGPVDLAQPLFASVSALVGPWFIVNVVLKEFWGRPRPVQTLMFGGDAPYVAPGTISDWCATNCSFVSGEAAAAFWLVWVPLVLPARWRRVGWAVVLGLAVAISLLRVAFGRHYISDVVTSAFIAGLAVTLTAWALQSGRGRAFVTRWADWSNAVLARWRGGSV